ncbi:MAG: hypothetical protein GY727_14815 [Gammaproteobacteria bacterium]|nr:hypothetical protein [Gammaproteobacteria bacterium]
MIKRILLIIGLLCLVAPSVFAANLVYVEREAEVKFTDSGGDVVLTLASQTADTAAISAQYDQGGATTSGYFTIRGVFEHDTAPVDGETVDIYISTSDGTDPSGQEGVADATLGSLDSLRNMMFVGSVVCESTANHQITGSFVVYIPYRYFSVVVHNNTSDSLETANLSWVIVTPIPPEIQ